MADRMRQAPTSAERQMGEILSKGAEPFGWHWLTQVVIEGYILDFYEPKARLCVEVDGLTHQENAQAFRDARRDRKLASVNVLTVRVNARDVYQRPEEVLSTVASYYARRRIGGKADPPLTPGQFKLAQAHLRRQGLSDKDIRDLRLSSKGQAILREALGSAEVSRARL
jgi:very-short-patch-repair endonuclease